MRLRDELGNRDAFGFRGRSGLQRAG